ncbi:DNA circularization protein [Methylolobus aquaticus]
MSTPYDPIRGVAGAVGAGRSALDDIRNLLAGRPDPLPCAFRGVPFYAVVTTNNFGRRVAPHQFPKYDVPYMEDMGRRAREFGITGFVIGPTWESARNDLITACEMPGLGTLQHPDYGAFQVICESCAVTESRVGALFKADFELRFTESGKNAIPQPVVNFALQIRNAIADAFVAIKDLLTLAYVVSRLPATLKATVQTFLGTSTKPVRRVPSNAVQKALSRLDATDIESPETVARLIAIPGSLTADIVARNLRERSGSITAAAPVGDSALITPYQAITTLEELIAVPPTILRPNTPTKRLARQSIVAAEVALKAAAAMEISRAVTYIDFQSLDEAQGAWERAFGALDAVMSRAADEGMDVVYRQLSGQKARVGDDIRERAPTLDRIVYRAVPQPLPALVISYREYGDVAHESAIVKRNRVRHPGFVQSDRLELLRAVDG